jgi:carboxymethylenebutenolidase
MNKDIKLQVKDKQADAYLADGKGPGVLVLHAWWGLKPFFKQYCDRLAKEGFTVLAPDLYQGRIAGTIDEAKALLEKRDLELMQDTVNAAKDHLHELVKGKIGLVGFSMGGGWALEIASTTPDEIGAMVIYYANGEADYGKITAKVMGHFSDNDEWEPNEYVDMTFDAFKKAGVDATRHVYPGVAHWFVEEDRPEYDPAAAQLSWDRTVEFLKKSL